MIFDAEDIPARLMEWTQSGRITWGPWKDAPMAYSTILPDGSFAGVLVCPEYRRSYLRVVSPDDERSEQCGESLDFPGKAYRLYEAARDQSL